MTDIETLRKALRTGFINQEEHAALDRIERVVEAAEEVERQWTGREFGYFMALRDALGALDVR